ncbi:glycosyltransferase family 2 protein [Sphingomonas sp. R86521]|uniref:glycosyltransferase family 2 protein n=1 Tax=Sphingomonas sp. R86521 TaxID=3093860 RepID=UPI0036D41F99
MTLLVRNAEDILAANIDFHRRQGVDFFVVTNNRSEDATVAIVEDYVRAGIAELLHEDSDDYSQARWVTRMARRAASVHGADWVVNNDDDEFWYSPDGTLREMLEAVPFDQDGVIVDRFNHPPLWNQDNGGFAETMVYREVRSLNALGTPLPPKLCHRGFTDIIVGQGNHAASRNDAALRTDAAANLMISHFPVRGFPALERKIALGGAAYARNTELHPSVGGTWRWLHGLYQAGDLRAWYDAQRLTPEAISTGLAEGSLVRDDIVPRVLGVGAVNHA